MCSLTSKYGSSSPLSLSLFLQRALPFVFFFFFFLKVAVEVLRGGARLSFTVPTRALGSDDTSRVLLWAGAVLQAPPPAVARQRGLASGGVYVASHHRGSPANKVRAYDAFILQIARWEGGK
jgi:hypothetical protein